MQRKNLSRLFGAISALGMISMAVLLGLGEARAADYYWDGGTSNANGQSDNTTTTGLNWLSGGLWDNGTTSATKSSWTVGDAAIFGGSAATETVTAPSAITVGNLTFGQGPLGAGASGTNYTVTGGTITLQNSTITTNTNTTISSVLTGTTGLTKAGNGTLKLTSGNTYASGTTVNAGTLELAIAGDTGIIRGPLTINSGAKVASSTGWSLGISNGVCVNTITINGGELNFSGGNTAGGTSASAITMTGGTISGATTAFDWYNGITSTPTLTTNAASTSSVINSGINLRLGTSGSLTCNVAQGTTSNGVDLVISGPIIQGGGATLNKIIKSGSGTMVLSGVNTYTGATTINDGTLNAGVAQNGTTSGPLGTSGNIVFGGGALQFSAASADWDPSARIAAATSIGAVKIDTNSQNVAFTTPLTSSQSGGLIKTGLGTLTLLGTNTYGGATTINGGTLKLNSSQVVSFTTTGTTTWTDPAGVTNVSYLVVGGGGQGGGFAGGGGAGGFLTGTTSVTPGSSYTVTVGAGGTGGGIDTQGGSGKASVFDTINAAGGGGGGSRGGIRNGASGGSGGGGSPIDNGSPGLGGTGTAGQGNAGGNGANTGWGGGGGGGAGAAGGNASGNTAGKGGAGLSSNITGSTVWYAGGGGGGCFGGSGIGVGGIGGGGSGANSGAGTAGAPNTGGGGGGSSFSAGGAGGSGIVVLSWFDSTKQILPTDTALVIGSGGTLDLFSGTQTVGSLADGTGGGSVINSGTTASTLTLNPTGGSTSFSGVIGGGMSNNAISLLKSGNGTQILSGPNTYTGTTTVSTGTLAAGAANTLSAYSDITVSGGTLDVSGYANTIKSLTVTGGYLDLGIGKLLTSNGLSSLGGGTINVSGTPSGSLIELIACASGISGDYISGTIPNGYALRYNSTNTALDLVSTGPIVYAWEGGHDDGDWATGSNWGGTAPPDAADTQVSFGSQSPANNVVDLVDPHKVGQITFTNGVSTTIQSSPSTPCALTLENTGGLATVSVAGTHSITAPLTLVSPMEVDVADGGGLTLGGQVSGEGLTKAGPGTLTLSGSGNNYAGTTVTGGTLVIASAGALPAGKSLSIGSGGTLILGGGMAMGQTASAEPVPEPGTLALLAIAGLAGVMIWRKRR